MPGREPLRDPMARLRKKSEFCMGHGHYLCQYKYCTCDCHEKRAGSWGGGWFEEPRRRRLAEEAEKARKAEREREPGA